MDRLNDVPPLQVTDAEVEAPYFNRVRLALARLGDPLRLELKKLRHLDMLLSHDLWICVDRRLNDLPVVAWSEFPVARDSLHTPVPCRLRIYHQHAGRIIPTVLAETDAGLAARLKRR